MNLLKELRAKKGLSLRGLAKAIGKSPAFLCKVERGGSTAGKDTLLKISEILGSKEEIFVAAGKIEPEIERILEEKEVRDFLRKISALPVEERKNRLKEIFQ